MSIAVVKVNKRSIILGADSSVIYYDNVQKTNIKKIRKVGKIYYVYAGCVEEADLFHNFLCNNIDIKNPSIHDDASVSALLLNFGHWLKSATNNNRKSISNDYIIVANGNAYEATGYCARRVDDTHAIGSGMIIAITAFYFKKSPKDAIKAACKLNPECQEPIHIVRIKRQ